MHKILIGLMALSMLFTVSCKDEDAVPSEPVFNPENPNPYINNWIYDEMSIFYLWNEELPAESAVSFEQDPSDFFDNILVAEDRFSWIQDNYEELLNSLRGVSLDPGMEVRYLRDEEIENRVIAQVLYVKPSSPADLSGLRRGDIITHINDSELTLNNYRALNADLSEPHSLRFDRYDFTEEVFVPQAPINISPVQFSEDPNYLDTIFTIDDKKIGYYVYNQFSAGPAANSTIYTEMMDDIFSQFRSNRINELIIDLRFNPGGSINVAINLGSLIAKGVSVTDVMVQRQYNPSLQESILNSPELGQNFLEDNFVFKTQNVGNLIDRVYILTGYRTASASELVINGLTPHMPVRIIGDTTAGKNQGSISLYEEDDPNNDWGMQPIILRIANGEGNSDYGNGFVPDIYERDVNRVIYPLGDIRENLLSIAVEEITGIQNARFRIPMRELQPLSPPADQRSLPLLMNESSEDQERWLKIKQQTIFH